MSRGNDAESKGMLMAVPRFAPPTAWLLRDLRDFALFVKVVVLVVPSCSSCDAVGS